MSDYPLETVFDIEADGLLDTVTKIHCLVAKDRLGTITLATHDDIRTFFERAYKGKTILIGHNIIGYDLRAVERILGVKPECQIIDTLPLSWYLNHDRVKHGLEEYGEDFGVPKPKIDDWQNQTLEEYAHRCQQDVEINWKLWKQLKRKLQELYTD